MSSSDTSFTLVSATGWPGSPGNNFFVVIDRGTSSEEKVLCSSNSGTTVTVSARGQDGTSATTHNSGATVSLCITAIDGDEANQITHLLGNGAEGSLLYGKGTGVLPAALAVGASGTYLGSNGTDPVWSYPTLTYAVQDTTLSTALSASPVTISSLASLVAGTYLLNTTVNVINSGATSLSILTTVVTGGASGKAQALAIFPVISSGTYVQSITASDIIVLSGTTTLSLTCTLNTGSNISLAAQGQTFSAVRIS
jgi:hypothetical protein